MTKLLSQITGSVLGLWLAVIFVAGVQVSVYPNSNIFGFSITQQWQMFLVLGIFLGLLNYFAKLFLKRLDLPLEIITLGVLSILAGAGLLWIVDMIFEELSAPWMYPLLYTTLIMWVLSLILQKFLAKD